MEIKINTILTLRILNTHDSASLFQLIKSNRNHIESGLYWVKDIQTTENVRGLIEDYKTQWKNQQSLTMAAIYKGEIVGMVSLNRIDKSKQLALLEFWISEEHTGKGIMAQCCCYIIEYGFKQLNLNKILTFCPEKHLKTRNVLTQIKFKCNAEKYIQKDTQDVEINTLCYQINRSNWLNDFSLLT
jgi:ribosomal-protein-serine acetyltransferase